MPSACTRRSDTAAPTSSRRRTPGRRSKPPPDPCPPRGGPLQSRRSGGQHSTPIHTETRLIKAEYVDELVETLVAIAQAYSRAGLKWAVRAKALIAADRLLSSFERTGRLDARASVPLKLLAWVELELCRVPQVLATIELYRVVATGTERPEEIAAKVPEQLQLQETVLGMLLMRADLDQLRTLERAPAVLERQGLTLGRDPIKGIPFAGR